MTPEALEPLIERLAAIGLASAYYDAARHEKRTAQPSGEQLSVGFEGLEVVAPPIHDPATDTMRQIVSLRMPDALLERVEAAARARGVSPSSLMRALIAAGLDRSYAAIQDDIGASWRRCGARWPRSRRAWIRTRPPATSRCASVSPSTRPIPRRARRSSVRRPGASQRGRGVGRGGR